MTSQCSTHFILRLTLRLAVLTGGESPDQRLSRLAQRRALTLERIGEYETAWRAHPAYRENPHPQDPVNPVVRAVFRHPPGRGGATHSYAVGPVRRLARARASAWATRTLGEFQCIAPVCLDPPTPVHSTRLFCVIFVRTGSRSRLDAVENSFA
ncbi:MAG: hypothetical protein WKF30_17175 [Pyrinomonadaceae bacterium]